MKTRFAFLFCFLWSAAGLASPVALKSFREVLEKVGNESPKLQARQYDALSSKSLALSKLLTWSPTVVGTASRGIKEWGLDSGETAALQAKLNLFRFGGDISALKEGSRTREQADLNFKLAPLTIEAEAATLIFQWLEVQKRLESQRSLNERKRELSRVAQNRYKMGQLPAQEVEKVRLDFTNSEIQIRQAQVQLLDLRSQLDGVLPGLTLVRDWPWENVDLKAKRNEKNLRDRMVFKVRDLEVQIRDSKSYQARTDWAPRLDLTSSWVTNEISPLGKGDWTSQLVLTIPFWEQGNSIASRNYWGDLKRAAAADLKSFELSETAKLQTLQERRSELYQNAMLARESAERARSLASESIRRFQAGRASVNDLLLDQARVFESESLAFTTMREYHLVLLETCLAAEERASRCY
jgi:outer membrane protein TolC